MNQILECHVCQYHYHSFRFQCPTCGCAKMSVAGHRFFYHEETPELRLAGLAKGLERARQLPQSPRVYELVD